MQRLLPIDARLDHAFVDALRRAWDDGDAVLPVDPRLPPPARQRLIDAMRPDAPVAPGDAVVVATSGSTGEPKGAVLTHGALAASAAAAHERLSVDPDRDRWLACLPPAHVGGLGVLVRSLLTGTPFTFDLDGGATLASLVGTQLRRLDTTRFRAILLGGGPPPPDRPERCVVTYGMTESGGGVVYDGRPLAGVEVRSVDGELHLRGPMLLRCYRDGRPSTDAEGWFATGDAGDVAPDGTVTVRGRLSEVITTGGEKVWPFQVESVLAGFPGVAEVAVAGRPDAEWGEAVVAYVVPAAACPPPSLEGLRAAVKEVLPPWCAPKRLVVLDALPRTALGKVRKAELPG